MILFPSPNPNNDMPVKPCLLCGVECSDRRSLSLTPKSRDIACLAPFVRLVYMPICESCAARSADEPAMITQLLELLRTIQWAAGADPLTLLILKGQLLEKGIVYAMSEAEE